MTTEAAHPADDPHRLLSNADDLAHRVRKDQRATWFPLLVFAALTFAAIPVRRLGIGEASGADAAATAEAGELSDSGLAGDSGPGRLNPEPTSKA